MSITVSLSLDGLSLTATTPSGRELTLPMDMRGLVGLKQLCQWDAKLQASLQASQKPFSGVPPLSKAEAQSLAQSYCASDYSRVCHCGADPDGPRCDGCPGPSGAGKIRKLDTKGHRIITLADLGLE